MSVLAIDQGTTSTRAMLVDDHGNATIVKVIEHQQIYPQQGWVEHDPEELIRNIQACLETVEGVSAIGIDNQGESCLAWHAETKETISPVIVWQDNRTHDVIERLKSEGAETLVQEKTGLPLDSYFSASKLAWIIKFIPQASELLAKGLLRLGTTDAFFLDRLTGKFITDITTASRTSLMNVDTGAWDKSLCDLFGVPMEALPKIVPTTGDFGSVTIKGKNIPITASVVDQQASLYGHGCRAQGDAKITFGTGAFALSITGKDCHRAPDKGLLPTIAWQFDGEAPTYALDGGVHCASSAVNWAKSLGLFTDFEQINSFEAPPAIERNLAFVPALAGLACPHWDRSAAGMWIGLSLDTTPLDMVQAVLEGVAMRAAEVLNAMNDFTPVGGAISVDGGMTNNPYFCQFLANVLQRDISIPQLGELTAFGTAMFAAGKGAKIIDQKTNTKLYKPNQTAGGYQQKFDDAIHRSKSWQ